MSEKVVEGIDVSNHKNFCAFPWKHLYKNPDHTVKLCCVDNGPSLGDLRNNSIDEIRSSEEFTEIRRQFLRDERPDRCSDCWYKEDNGGVSLRKSGWDFNRIDKNNAIFDEINYHSIAYLDYRTSNLCNLGCKICSPHFSSKLAQAMKAVDMDEVKITHEDGSSSFNTELLNFHKHRVKKEYISPVIEDSLEVIYFAGGEPILAEEHWYIISELKRKKLFDTTIFYTTNGTILDYKGKNLLEEVKDFKKVMISLSLDGIGESFNYWRTGGDWETIVKNLDLIKSFRDSGYDNFEIGVNSSIGWMNFNEVFKLHKFLIDNNYILSDHPSIGHTLNSQPVVYNPGVIFEDTPTIFIPELLEYMDQYEDWLNTAFTSEHKPQNPIPFFRNTVNKREYTPDKLKSWLVRNKKLDSYFKTNFKDVYNFKTKDFSNMLYRFYLDPDNCPEELKS